MAASEEIETELTLVDAETERSDAETVSDEAAEAEAELQRQMEEIERAIQLRRHELEQKTREREREQRRRELEAQLEERKRMLEHLTRTLEDESAEIPPPKPIPTSAAAAAAVSSSSVVARKPELVASSTVENLLRTVDLAITGDEERREFNEASDWMFEVSRVRLKFDDMTTDARKLLIDRYYKTTGLTRRTPFVENPVTAFPSLPVKSPTFGVADEPAPPSVNPMNVAFHKGYLKEPDQILAKTMKGALGAPSADIPIHFSKLKGVMSRSTTDVRR